MTIASPVVPLVPLECAWGLGVGDFDGAGLGAGVVGTLVGI